MSWLGSASSSTSRPVEELEPFPAADQGPRLESLARLPAFDGWTKCFSRMPDNFFVSSAGALGDLLVSTSRFLVSTLRGRFRNS